MSVRRPDVQHIAITFADDTVAVMAFVTAEYGPDGDGNRVRTWSRDATTVEVEAEIAKSRFDKAVKRWAFVDATDVPTDRTYRNAWRHDDEAGFQVDMAHARELHREHLRAARAAEFAELDTAYMRADEAGDVEEKLRVAHRKQALRDVTEHPEIEAAETPDELKLAGSDVLRTLTAS